MQIPEPSDVTETQAMLRETIRRYFSQSRASPTSKANREGPVDEWERWDMAANDLGLVGLSFPEALGGIGGGAIEQMIAMEELGEALAIVPYLSLAVLPGAMLIASRAPLASEVIRSMVARTRVIAAAFGCMRPKEPCDLSLSAIRTGDGYVVNGTSEMVLGASFASHLLVGARIENEEAGEGISLFLVDGRSEGIARSDHLLLDGSSCSDFLFRDVFVPRDRILGDEGMATPWIERAIDEATAAICAEGVGLTRSMLADTVGYVRQRQQFGKPIGSFQALQHRLVDMFMQVEQAANITLRATLALAGDPIERTRAVSQAKVVVNRACRSVGQGAIQMHGGMGMTAELRLGNYFKRAIVVETLFGSADHHLERLEQLPGTDFFPEAISSAV